MTDDAFLRRLAAADPVDPATLPSADDADARRLIDDILAADPIPGPVPAAVAGAAGSTPVDHGAGDPVQLVDVDQPSQRSRGLGRGRALLVSAAAAVMLLVGAVAVLAPDNTPSALAEVHDAAAATADADTGRVQTTFTLDHQGTPDQGTLSGAFEAVYNGRDLGFSLGFDELPDEVGPEMLAELPAVDDIRLVDDVIYVEQGGQWMAIDTDGLLGSMVNRLVDPRTVLDTIQGLTETTEIGSAEIDGADTTHYRSVVDLADESLSQSGWMAFEGMAIEAEGEVTIDLYVDGDGVLRRFDLSGEVREPVEGGESGVFEVITTFTDIGADLQVEAPEGAVPFNPMDEMFEELDE